MGVEIDVTVFWGVWEPKGWVKSKRAGTESVEFYWCPTHGRIESAFCPQCGQKAEVKTERKKFLRRAEDVYGENPWESDVLHNPDGYGDGTDPLLFGISLASVDGKRGDTPETFDEPSAGDKAKLQAFLTRIGYEGPEPKFHLVCCYS